MKGYASAKKAELEIASFLDRFVSLHLISVLAPSCFFESMFNNSI